MGGRKLSYLKPNTRDSALPLIRAAFIIDLATTAITASGAKAGETTSATTIAAASSSSTAAIATAISILRWLARRRNGFVAMKGMILIGWHRIAQQALDIPQIASVFGATKRNGITSRPRPGGAPDTVHISFGLHG